MPATRGKPIGPDDYDAVKRHHRKGLSRNEIARVMGRSGRTVSRIASELGLTFERGEMVKEATQARKVDAKAKRTALALALLEDAEKLRRQLFEPCVAWNFGGKDNTFESTLVDQPSFRDKRDLMAAIGLAVDRAVKLDEYDRDTDGGDAKSVIGDLMAGIKAAWRDAQPAE